jgi:hypothetical protein
VRIVDSALAEDYSLRRLPALAFFRQHTPILYTGDINNQEEVFEFLFQNKHTAEEDVIVEDVDPERLEILINYVDFVVVLFYAASILFSPTIIFVSQFKVVHSVFTYFKEFCSAFPIPRHLTNLHALSDLLFHFSGGMSS